MVYVFSINTAISIVMGIALWLVWRSDREQKFTLHIAMMQWANACATLSYLAYRSDPLALHVLGGIGMSLGGAFQFTTALLAAKNLRGELISSRRKLLFFLPALTGYALIAVLDFGPGWIFGNAILYAVLGNYVLLRPGQQQATERVIGLVFLAIGINSMLPMFLGESTGALLQVSMGAVWRVVLCLGFVFAALARTDARVLIERKRFIQLTENSQHGMMVFDLERVHYANAAAARLFGFASAQDLIQAGPLSTEPPEFREQTRMAVQKVLNGEQTLHDPVIKRFRRDGASIYVEMHGWLTVWDGKPAVQVSMSDNTARYLGAQKLEQLERERELERIQFTERIKNNLLSANAQLEAKIQVRTRELMAANAAKNQFLANMSHEIRTPMNAVMGLMQLLGDTAMTPRQQDYLTKAQGAARSLLKLLNDILDFSKIDAGKLELEPQNFELDRVLRDLGVIVSVSAEDRPLDLRYRVDPSVPAILSGDAARLQQVLLNLYANAIKFTPKGEVVLDVAVVERSERQVRLSFAVRDTGIGISQQNQKHIFEAFSQGDGSITRRFGGSGLGLAISRKLISLMGGELRVESEVDQGSTFSFSLDFPCADQTSVQSPEVSRVTAALRVLLVDDNPGGRNDMQAMLAALGWEVQTCASGEAAVALVMESQATAQQSFDVLLADCDMPDMNGWQVLDAVSRNCPDNKPLRILMSCHGRGSLNRLSQAQQADLDGFLVKPLTAPMVREAVMLARSGNGNLRNTQRTASHAARQLGGLHLLLVEDNALNQMVAQELLVLEGAKVDVVENGLQAVDAVCNAPKAYDALLMDMQMPVMDGCTATRRIREVMGLRDLPIIAMTANTMASDRDACLAAGMNAHIGKPLDLNYMVKIILEQTGRAHGLVADSLPPAAPEFASASKHADPQSALRRIGGDRHLYMQVLQAYLEDIEALPEELHTLGALADWPACALLMHTFKGTSSTVGALRMQALCSQAESSFRGLDPKADPRTLVSHILETAQLTRADMLRVRDELAAVPTSFELMS
jgi:PAS domain S-box-containing protein